jgi:type IV pilus assembly protein PilW
MHPTHRASRSQGGFSLIELMVGMTIGLLAGIIIIQVMTLFEAQRRTTTGSADAQTNGGIALYAIGRELAMAGYPLLPAKESPLECTAIDVNTSGITANLSPVGIGEGVAAAGVAASDSITIRYGTSQMGGAPTSIEAVPGANVLTLKSGLACSANDVSIVISGASCKLSKVNSKPTADSVELLDAGGASAGNSLACLGNWFEVTYAVNPATGNLDRTIRMNGGLAATTPSVVGVVNLQAQYGVSATAADNKVTGWVDATGSWAPGAITIADRNRIKAVRIAVIARNEKVEVENVSAACSSTTAAAPAGVCAWAGTAASPAPAVDLSPMDANWARYRYRVFETIIPLRNVIWSKETF